MTDYEKPKDLNTAARIIGISITSVRRLIDCGKLTAYQVGPKKAIRISQGEIERYINESKINPM